MPETIRTNEVGAGMAELVCLDWGPWGLVAIDVEASYVRCWSDGAADDRRWLRQLDVVLDAVVTHRLRYLITDWKLTGTPNLEVLEHLDEVIAALVKAGCGTRFSVSPDARGVVSGHVQAAHARQRELGMRIIEVSTLAEALERVRELNGQLPATGPAPRREGSGNGSFARTRR